MSANMFKMLYGTSNCGKEFQKDRADHDFYATDPIAIHKLLELEEFQHTVVEPCCGMGHMAEALREHGHDVIAFDICDRGYGIQQDFLNWMPPDTGDFDIITNPPYAIVDKVIEKALSCLTSRKQKVAMFVRLLYLEGQKRQAFFRKFPPKTIHVSSARITCAKNGDFEKYKSGAAVCYAWFIWQKGFHGQPTINWF